jgi:hypothetical protein
MKEVIKKINETIYNYHFLELSFFKLDKNNLIIVGGEDLMYFHEIEIEFVNIHTIESNYNFKIDTNKASFFLIENCDESIFMNKKYGVLKGNNIFKFISEDNQSFYIVSESILFRKKIVKYFK